MNRDRRAGHRLAGVLAGCALGLAVTHAQTPLPEQEQPEPPQLQLKLERELSGLSYERLADGSAAGQPQPEVIPQPVVTAPTEEPAVSRFFSTVPALVLAGVVLALIAFAAGVLTARRRTVVRRDDDAPVQLWADAEPLEREVDTLREQLSEQQTLNESLQADRDAREDELVTLRRQRDEAASQSQFLQMRGDDEELSQAHETIDELRAEIERLRGADTDLERDPHRFADSDTQTLRADLEARDFHIHELEELMQGVRAERDALEQSLAGRDAQVQALEQTLDHRDEELQVLRGELASAQEQSGAAADDRVRELSGALDAARNDAAREIESLQDQLNERHEAEERAEELQLRNQQLETSLGERRDELIQLARQNDVLKARLGDLELALRRDEDLTARLELGSLQAGDAAADQALATTPDQARQHVLELQAELAEAKRKIEELSGGDSEIASLERQNVKLSAMVLQRDNMVAELEARVAQLGGDDEQPQEWTSTVSSLENELRRKTSVIDDQADHLREGEHRLGELQSQVASLNERLDKSRDESDSLRALLAEAEAQAKTLSDELDRERHAGRARQAGEPSQPLPDDVGPEALESTVLSRQDLVRSLQSILDEENVALTEARKRASEREDMLVSLENEIAANRITIAALQNRVSNAREHGDAPPSGETQRLERELQRGVRMIEKLRTDLHLWRRRVRPLHEAVMARDTRIRSLDARLRALHDSGFGAVAAPAQVMSVQPGADGQIEKDDYFHNIAELNADIERLENELADTGLELSRAQAANETQVAEIENLEAARAAQAMRIDELHHELINLGVNPEALAADGGNVVELQAHRPGS